MTEKMPWEDYAPQAPQAAEKMPWEDYAPQAPQATQAAEKMPWEDYAPQAPTFAKPPVNLPKQKPDNLRTKVEAAATGAVQGYTAGLSKYATAGMAYLADRARNMMDSTPGMTWEQALEYTKAEQQSLAEAAPLSYGAGAVAGAVANPIGRAIPLGKTSASWSGLLGRLPQPLGGFGTMAAVGRGAAEGAVYGGVAGFSNNEDLGEAAQGAALGGIVGGGVPLIAGGVQRLADKNTVERLVSPIEKVMGSSKVNDIKQLRALLSPQYGDDFVKKASVAELKEAAASFVRNVSKDPLAASKWGMADDVNASFWDSLKQQGAASAIGAAGGAGGALAFGQDPMTGAITGAVGGPTIRSLAQPGVNKPLLDYAATKMTQMGAGLPYRPHVGGTARAGMAAIPSIMSNQDSFAEKSGVVLTPESQLRINPPSTLKEANSSLFNDLFK